MNTAEVQQKLILAARASQPGDRVPYAFEKRIMARLARVPKVDPLCLWSRALWRAAAPCVALMVVLGAWTYLFSPASSTPEQVADLESTILAPLENLETYW